MTGPQVDWWLLWMLKCKWAEFDKAYAEAERSGKFDNA